MTDDKKLSIYNRYFIYSKTEADRFKKIAETMSGAKNYALGVCYTNNGLAKNYTSIVNDLNKVKQTDAVIVMQGDIRKIAYKQPVMY